MKSEDGAETDLSESGKSKIKIIISNLKLKFGLIKKIKDHSII